MRSFINRNQKVNDDTIRLIERITMSGYFL